MSAETPWWERAFGAAYLEVYAHRDEASARREAAFAAAALGIARGARVLDAACGSGRHARALSETGARVTGVDRSVALLGEARRAGGAASYVAGDLRALPCRAGAFDAVVSFFTSFGYFDAAGDRAQVRELRRVLRPGGGLLLDFLNAPRVASTLVASSERTVGTRVVRETRAVRRGRVEKRVEVEDAGRVVDAWCESVRLYERDEIRGLLGEHGLSVRAEFGDLAGGDWSPTSERLVLRAEAA